MCVVSSHKQNKVKEKWTFLLGVILVNSFICQIDDAVSPISFTIQASNPQNKHTFNHYKIKYSQNKAQVDSAPFF